MSTAKRKTPAKADEPQKLADLSEALAADHAEPTTLVGGAELAGAQLATNQIGTMMEPDAEGIPDRDEK